MLITKFHLKTCRVLKSQIEMKAKLDKTLETDISSNNKDTKY